MKSFLLTLLLVVLYRGALSSACAEPGNDPRMARYDVRHYDLSVSFDPGTKSFAGKVGISAAVVHALDEFVLCASSSTLTIDSVDVGGKRVPFRREDDRLIIRLPAEAGIHSLLKVTVHYHGTSGFNGVYDDGGIYFASPGRFASSSEPMFARRWWPCKDVPSDKATARLQFTVPDSLTAVSNGLLVDQSRRNGKATYTWETRYPIATYLISVAAAVYREFTAQYTGRDGRPMEIHYYVFPEDLEKAKFDFAHTTSVLEYFASHFCEYPFIEEKFGFAEVEGDLTMENQTLCSIQQTLITGNRDSELTLVHETAHHWWGDLITPADWHHTWLSEGFATYAEALYVEHTKGHAAYEEYIDRLMSTENGAYAGSVIGERDTAFWDSFAPRVYYKGAIVLHMLRGIVGDSAFFAIMRNYLSNPAYRYANATTENFEKECEHVYGRSLRWFFRQWVYASTASIDRPVLEYEWRCSGDRSPYSLLISLRQQTAGTLLYTLPLTLALAMRDSTHLMQVVDSLEVQSFSCTLPDTLLSLTLNPDRAMFVDLKPRGGK